MISETNQVKEQLNEARAQLLATEKLLCDVCNKSAQDIEMLKISPRNMSDSARISLCNKSIERLKATKRSVILGGGNV